MWQLPCDFSAVLDTLQSVALLLLLLSIAAGALDRVSFNKCDGVQATAIIRNCCCCCCRLQVQCTGTVPTVSIDKCDGVQAYIPHRLAANPNFQVHHGQQYVSI
jgi:hypothetical protein